MSEPTVSIIMANYNGARHLAAAIRSALSQTLPDIELLIADDASRDDSLAVALEASAGDRRVSILATGQNGGPAAARNRALDQARGRWIAVFDSDDLMAPDRLERLVRIGEASGAGVVADNLALFADGQDAVGEPFLRPAAERWVSLAGYIGAGRMYSRTPNLGYLKPLIRRSALGQDRYRQDLKIGEDYDLVVRLMAQGARLRLDPQAGYHYRRHGASISASMSAEHLRGMLAADADLRLPDDGDVRRAQAARTRSLEAALAYDGVIRALKGRDLSGGLRQALARPRIWPLLTMPVTARLRRMVARLQPAGATA